MSAIATLSLYNAFRTIGVKPARAWKLATLAQRV